MVTRAIFLFALTASLFTGIVRASGSQRLAGSIFTMKEAVLKSDAIFVGQMTYLSKGGAGGPGEIHTFRNKVKVSQVLKGFFDAQSTVTFVQMTDLGEQRAKTYVSYIFFVTKNGKIDDYYADPFIILKLLPATSDNIATFKKLISN